MLQHGKGVVRMDMVIGLSPWWGTILGTLFSWGMTALGAAAVFGLKRGTMSLDGYLGFGAGIMLAASFWSLLAPAIEQSGGWLIPAIGFAAGGIFLMLAERGLSYAAVFAREVSRKRSFLLILAVTLHNIPEGMAIGVAFGSGDAAAWLLALGIGLQNFPEGAAVAFPLFREGYSRGKSFFYGQASGFVEPLAAIVGLWLCQHLTMALPLLLAFSAGAMVTVVGGELLPEAVEGSKTKAVSGLLLGFLLMMVLDVALG